MNNPSAAFAASHFRYRGYHQTGTVREFTFEDIEEKRAPHRLLLEVDTGLLSKHHVHFQDAPNLCLQLLAGLELTSSPGKGEEVRITILEHDLADLIEKAESEAATKHKKKGK